MPDPVIETPTVKTEGPQSIDMIRFSEIAEENARVKAQLEQLRKERDQKDAELRANRAAAGTRFFNERFEALQKEGKVSPPSRAVFMAVFNQLDKAEQVIKFDDNQPTMTFSEALFHGLSMLSPVAENLRGVDVKTFAEGKKKSMEEDDLEEISEELFESKVAAEAKKLAKEMAESNGNKPNDNMLDATKMAEKSMFAQYRIKGRK